jgi:hypothetical protein
MGCREDIDIQNLWEEDGREESPSETGTKKRWQRGSMVDIPRFHFQAAVSGSEQTPKRGGRCKGDEKRNQNFS